jgi:FSR family fosmidomycin resistance protein-like MFS transporter
MVLPPLLPFLARDFQLSYLQSGVLVFMASIVSAFLQPVVGYLADIKMGRRLAIATGLLLYALTAAAIGIAPNYALLLVVLFLMGIGGSTYHPQSTFFIAFYFRKYRATASGIHGVANPVGFVIAPIVVTTLLTLTGSWRTTAMLMFIPGLAAAVTARLGLDEPKISGPRGFLAAFRSRSLILLTLISGIGLGVFVAFTAFIPFYSLDTQSTVPASWWLPMTLLPGIVSQPAGGLIADRMGRRNLIVMALAALALGLLGFIYATGGTALIFAMFVGFCLGLLVPVFLIYAAELAVGERVGTAVGIQWGFAMGMASIAPLWVGYLRDISPDFRMAFLSLVVVTAIGGAMALFLPGEQAPEKHEGL